MRFRFYMVTLHNRQRIIFMSMKAFALFAAVLLGTACPDGATLVTASNSSLNVRELTLAAKGSDLIVKYVDVGGEAGTLKAADLVEIAFNGGRAATTARPVAID